LWFESPDRKTVIPRYLVPGDHIRDDRLSWEAHQQANEVAAKNLAERFAKTPFGPRLVELRTRRGWSREQLSEASQLDVATIEAIETGEIAPDLAMVGRLWRGFGLTFFSELFKDRQP
jgi:ribosome-binding protein aMBF1 (putative translation factor)